MIINTAIRKLDQQYVQGADRVRQSGLNGREIQSSGSDILEISDEARGRYAEKMDSPLARAVSHLVPGAGTAVEASENIYDSGRKLTVESIRRSIETGTYDFDTIAGSSGMVDTIMSKLDVKA